MPSIFGPPEEMIYFLRKSIHPRLGAARTSLLKTVTPDCFHGFAAVAHSLRVQISFILKIEDTKLCPLFLARPKRFELPFSGIGIRCVIQLRHGR